MFLGGVQSVNGPSNARHSTMQLEQASTLIGVSDGRRSHVDCILAVHCDAVIDAIDRSRHTSCDKN